MWESFRKDVYLCILMIFLLTNILQYVRLFLLGGVERFPKLYTSERVSVCGFFMLITTQRRRKMTKWILATIALTISAITPVSMGAVYFDDSVSHPISNNTYHGATVYLDSKGARTPGTSINMTGGSVGSLNAYNNSSINMTGGHADFIEAHNDATVTIAGGVVHSLIKAQDDASVTLAGGSALNGLLASHNSKIIMSGGYAYYALYGDDNATISMTGGQAANIIAYGSSTVTVSGGLISGGFEQSQNGIIYLDGYNFQVIDPSGNKTTLSNGDKLRDFVTYTGTITGVLADGSVLNNIFSAGGRAGTGDIVIIPEPASLSLLGLGGLLLSRRRQ